MTLLPAAGTLLSYNGVVFDGTSQLTVSDEFVKDTADRTTVYQQITLNAKGVVAIDTGTNASLENLRHKLGATGQTLIFTGHGFGNDLIVNQAAGGKRDVRWGPKPKVLSWNPIGSYRACEIEWQVVTCITPCPQSSSVGILAINYEVDYKMDDRGYSTRVITGYVEIAQTRVGLSVPDTADAYRDVIAPTVPVGFSREQSWHLSADKSRVDFTITDKQLDTTNPYPEGVVKISGKHRHRVPKSLANSKGSISANIEMANDYPVSRGLAVFQQIVASRLAVITASGKAYLIDDITIEEDLFGHSASYSLNYRILSTIDNLLASTGIWTPLGNTWNNWSLSMQQTFGNRGHSGLTHLAQNDAIVDLCGGQGTIPFNTQSLSQTQPPAVNTATLQNSQPVPEQSWLQYDSKLVGGRTRPVVRQSVLQTPDDVSEDVSPNSTQGLDFGNSGGDDDVLQQSGRSRHVVHLVGSATRVGHRVPKPSVTSIGSKSVVEFSAGFVEGVLRNCFGVPIYGAAWDIVYGIDNSPGAVAPPANVKDLILP